MDGNIIALISFLISVPTAALSIYNFFEARRVPQPIVTATFVPRKGSAAPGKSLVEVSFEISLSGAKADTVLEQIGIAHPYACEMSVGTTHRLFGYSPPRSGRFEEFTNPLRGRWKLTNDIDGKPADVQIYIYADTRAFGAPILIDLVYRSRSNQGYTGRQRLARLVYVDRIDEEQ